MELILKDAPETIYVSDVIFNKKFNKSLIHQIITAYRAILRKGSKAQKNRGMVSFSGKKPWRQKGTGRARSGSLSSPIWRSGGVTFAAKPKSYDKKVNKKMYRTAISSIFSELIRKNRLIVVKYFTIPKPKTKLLINKLIELGLTKALVITNKLDKFMILASRNIKSQINICNVYKINPLKLISFSNTIITVDALRKMEELLK